MGLKKKYKKKDIYPLLAEEAILARGIWLKSITGWRQLEDNEFRASNVPYCSHKLTRQLISPPEEPDAESPFSDLASKDENGIVTVAGAKAVAGTWNHEAIQEILEEHKRDFGISKIGIEERVTYVEDSFSASGTIDVLYPHYPEDIKTVSTYIFQGVCGARNVKENTYTELKIKSSIQQALFYCYMLIMSGKNVDKYSIRWVNRDSFAFKIQFFKYDRKKVEPLLEKLRNVMICVKKSRREGILYLPPLSGIQFCELNKNHDTNYCDYHQANGGPCPGKIWLTANGYCQKVYKTDEVVEKPGLMPAQDALNKYTEKKQGVWYCKICKKPLSEVVNPGLGIYTPQHLFFDHHIDDFNTAGLPGKPMEVAKGGD